MSTAWSGEKPAAHLQTFLAFDFGPRRTGVAIGSRLRGAAQPERSIATQDGTERLQQVAQRIRAWQPDALVVGVPTHPDGAVHENTRRAQRFARQLQGRFGLPVFTVDERYSTAEARQAGASDLDAEAACIILEQFLRSLA